MQKRQGTTTTACRRSEAPRACASSTMPRLWESGGATRPHSKLVDVEHAYMTETGAAEGLCRPRQAAPHEEVEGEIVQPADEDLGVSVASSPQKKRRH